MATLVLSFAGAAIAAEVGASIMLPLALSSALPAIGWTAGNVIGNLLTGSKGETQFVEGPRLTDLKVQSSTYGRGIPWVRGRVRVAGNIIWSAAVQEHTTTTVVEAGGGKDSGGGTTVVQTSYYYTCKFAIALCEGTILGVRKVWLNGSLIYNVSANASASSVLGSSTAFTVHNGAADQEPDALIESIKGVGNTPAYRGTAYVVFNDFNLTSYNIRTLGQANFEFEVITAGSTLGLQPALAYNSGGMDFQANQLAHRVSQLGEVWLNADVGANIERTTRLVNMYSGAAIMQQDWGVGMQHLGLQHDGSGLWLGQRGALNAIVKVWFLSRAGALSFVDPPTSGPWAGSFPQFIEMYQDTAANTTVWGWGVFGVAVLHANFATNECDIETPAASLTNPAFVVNANRVAGRMYVRQRAASGSIGYFSVTEAGYPYTTVVSFNAGFSGAATLGPDGYLYAESGNAGEANLINKYTPDGVLVDTATLTDLNPNEGSITSIIVTNQGVMWVQVDQSSPSLKRFYKINTGTMEVEGQGTRDQTLYSQYFIGPYAFNNAALFVGVGTNDGRVYMVEPFSRIEPSLVDLGNDVVKPLCQRPVIGRTQLPVLADTDIDVSLLVGTEIHGVVMANRAPIRSMLEPLMVAFMFDAVERDWKTTFVPRGNSPTVTIDEDLLAAREDNIDATPDKIVLSRKNEMELPLGITVSYLSLDNNYQPLTQSSRRSVVNSQEVRSIGLPIVLTDDEAKQLATILEYVSWSTQVGARFVTTRDYMALDPTDVVRVPDPAGGDDFVIRISKKSEDPFGIIAFDGEFEDPEVYTQTISGVPALTPDESVPLRGPSLATLVDMPMILEVTNDPGFIMAAYGTGTVWQGVQLFQSTDDGENYNALALGTLQTESVIGTAMTVLGGTADSELNEVFDYRYTVDVVLADSSMSLSSSTRENVLKGANYMMLGNELIQFVTATLLSPLTYRLSGLLRGRKGTEWAMGSHQSGENAVLITTSRVASVPQNFTNLNVPLLYKAVSFGSTLEDTFSFTFTNTGRRRKPLAPWSLTGGRNAAGDLSIKWAPRTRFPTNWVNGINAPIGESQESYAVYIPSVAAPVRIITSSTPEATYTAAQQTEDYGSPQNPIELEVAQISPEAGVGYATSGEL